MICKVEPNQFTSQVDFFEFYRQVLKKNALVPCRNSHTQLQLQNQQISYIFSHVDRSDDLDSFFYCGICFTKSEKEKINKWFIGCFIDLYKVLDIPLSLIWLSDNDPGISVAIA